MKKGMNLDQTFHSSQRPKAEQQVTQSQAAQAIDDYSQQYVKLIT